MDKSIENQVGAHSNEIAALAVNNEGTLLASASTKGTIIRLFSVEGGDLLQELRRGTNKAEITNIIFHPSLNILAGTSNKTSIHVWEIKKSIDKCIEKKDYGFSNGDKKNNVMAENRKSNFSFLGFVNKYFTSDYGLSKIKIEEKEKLCAFDVKNHKLSIMTYDRLIYYVELPKVATRYMENVQITKF